MGKDKSQSSRHSHHSHKKSTREEKATEKKPESDQEKSALNEETIHLANRLMVQFVLQSEHPWTYTHPASCCLSGGHPARTTTVYYLGRLFSAFARLVFFFILTVTLSADLTEHVIGSVLLDETGRTSTPTLKGYQYAAKAYVDIDVWHTESIHEWIRYWLLSEYVFVVLRHLNIWYVLRKKGSIQQQWAVLNSEPGNSELEKIAKEFVPEIEPGEDNVEMKEVPEVEPEPEAPISSIWHRESSQADLLMGKLRKTYLDTTAVEKCKAEIMNLDREQRTDDTTRENKFYAGKHADWMTINLKWFALGHVLAFVLIVAVMCLTQNSLRSLFFATGDDIQGALTFVGLVMNGLIPIAVIEFVIQLEIHWFLRLFRRGHTSGQLLHWNLIATFSVAVGIVLVSLFDHMFDTSESTELTARRMTFQKRDQTQPVGLLLFGCLLLFAGACCNAVFVMTLHNQAWFPLKTSTGMHILLRIQHYIAIGIQIGLAFAFGIFGLTYSSSTASQCDPKCSVPSMRWFTDNVTNSVELYTGSMNQLSTHAYNVTMATCKFDGMNVSSLGEDCEFSLKFVILFLGGLCLMALSDLFFECALNWRSYVWSHTTSNAKDDKL